MSVVGRGQALNSLFLYEWEIDNYSSYNEMAIGKPLYSPTFNLHNISWYLVVYPGGDCKESQEFIALYLSLDKINTPTAVEVHAQFACTFIDSDRKTLAIMPPDTVDTFNNSTMAWGRTKFLKKSLVANSTNDTKSNKITIVCEILITEMNEYKTYLTFSPIRTQHFKAFKSFMNNQQLSDVTFALEDKEIFAHEVVLAANSTVFAAMFEHKMKENEENIVTIEDISFDIFNELLRFIYTGECTLSEDFVSGLFEAADKYQILNLKKMCEEKLCKNLSGNNVLAVLKLADMHSAESLKKEAINFIALNGKEILDKPEFELLQTLNSQLFKDVMRGIFEHTK